MGIHAHYRAHSRYSSAATVYIEPWPVEMGCYGRGHLPTIIYIRHNSIGAGWFAGGMVTSRRPWISIGMMLVGGIFGVVFGFAGNYKMAAIFGVIFVAGFRLR